MQEKRVTFNNRWLPYLFILPQMLITLIFFIWPASQAMYQSLLLEDPFGLSSKLVWLDNFKDLFRDPLYIDSFIRTIWFSFTVMALSLGIALILAAQADKVIKGSSAYKTLLIWPYAVATPLAGVLWLFMFNPANGMMVYFLKMAGYNWNHVLNGNQAMGLIIAAAVWRQVSYNFIFFLAGLGAIPKSLIESAAIDGASPSRRFWNIIFPLLAPTTFFLMVMNLIYAFFDTFGIVHAVTQGGPGTSTTILIYKVFNDGFIGLDLGSSSAQSVILMTIVISLTFVQFRYIEKKVNY